MIRSRPVQETFRKRTNFAIAVLSEFAAPLLSFGARTRCRRSPRPADEWRRGVLLGAGHIGDILYNTGSLPVLKQAFPNCEWYFVASAPADQILLNNPFVTGTVASVADIDAADVAICYNSGGYWRDLLAATRAGIPNRVGYVHKGFSGLVTRPVQINYPQPYPAYFRDLVAQLTGKSPTWSLRPEIHPSPKDAAQAQAIWAETGLGKKPVVACFLTSRQGAGVWPAHKFAEAVALLEANGCYQTVLCGTVADASLLEKLKIEFGLQATKLAGKLDLLALGCFLQKCAVVLCPDSGPRHLANAVQTPVVFVRNFAVGKIETGVYCESEIDAAPDLEYVSPSDEESAFARLQPARVAELVRRASGSSGA